MNKFALILLSSICLCSCKTNAPFQDSRIDGLPVVEASKDKFEVVIKLYENQELPMGTGFSVFIDGWEANDSILVEAIGPDNKKINLIANGAKLPVNEFGHIEFSIPYSHNKLAKGRWTLVVSGRSGKHGHYFNVPNL